MIGLLAIRSKCSFREAGGMVYIARDTYRGGFCENGYQVS